MRHYVFLDLCFKLSTFCLATISCYAIEDVITCPKIDVSINLRKDSLDWNIAGVGDDPNVASLLKWDKIKSFGGGARLGALIYSKFPVEIKGSYNKIFSGKNQDFDFADDDKMGLFLKSRSNASRGELFDLRAEIGMNISCLKGITLVPHVGYSLDEQHLKEYNGFTEINTLDPDDVGPIKGLNSGYNASWSGPYIGAKGYIPFLKGSLGLGFDYYYPNYRAKGHANLRTDIIGKHFFHKAHGFGKEFFAGFQSRIQEKLLVEVKFKFGRFWTKKGDETETIRGINGLIPIKIDLNRVQWSSKSISAHLIKNF